MVDSDPLPNPGVAPAAVPDRGAAVHDETVTVACHSPGGGPVPIPDDDTHRARA
jgi:hypothetical protein